MNIKELADATSGPVRAALLALEAKVMMLELDLGEAIEQHESFRQEVSDVAEEVVQRQGKLQALLSFIIPAPKPDPLVEAMVWVGLMPLADDLRAALDAFGFEIREKGQ